MAWGPGSQIAFQIFMHCESGLGHTRCEVTWNNQKMGVSNLKHGPGTQRESSRLEIKLAGYSHVEERVRGKRTEHQEERVWEGALQ